MAEESSQLFERLDDPDLGRIATWKIEGFTVERRLAMILTLLSESAPDDNE